MRLGMLICVCAACQIGPVRRMQVHTRAETGATSKTDARSSSIWSTFFLQRQTSRVPPMQMTVFAGYRKCREVESGLQRAWLS